MNKAQMDQLAKRLDAVAAMAATQRRILNLIEQELASITKQIELEAERSEHG